MPFGRPGDGLRDSFHDLTIAHLNHELARTILCCTCNMQLSRWRRGSWVASTISESRIGTMNQRRTGARTALSASASDLIRADMAVRAPTAGSWRGSIAGWARQLNRNVTRFGNDKFFDLDGSRVERELSQDHLCDVRRQPLNQLPAPALAKLEQAPRHGVVVDRLRQIICRRSSRKVSRHFHADEQSLRFRPLRIRDADAIQNFQVADDDFVHVQIRAAAEVRRRTSQPTPHLATSAAIRRA